MSRNDKIAWELGWDFALYGWSCPEDACEDFCDGFHAFNHGGHRSTKKPSLFEKKWLQLRMSALNRGKFIDPCVTADFIKMLLPSDRRCPVTGQALTYATLEDTDWSVERANNDEDYVRGNLIIISVRANAAKSNFRYSRICEFADGTLTNDRLSQREWRRLAELVTPMNTDSKGGFSGVVYLEGQRVACGTRVSGMAQFQSAIAGLAVTEIKHQSALVTNCYFEVIERALCQNRNETRAYRKLLVAVRQRAKHVRSRHRVWGSVRVHRKLGVLCMALGGITTGTVERLAAAVTNLEERTANHPRMVAMKRAGIVGPIESAQGA